MAKATRYNPLVMAISWAARSVLVVPGLERATRPVAVSLWPGR